jgi:hypothetical protein
MNSIMHARQTLRRAIPARDFSQLQTSVRSRKYCLKVSFFLQFLHSWWLDLIDVIFQSLSILTIFLKSQALGYISSCQLKIYFMSCLLRLSVIAQNISPRSTPLPNSLASYASSNLGTSYEGLRNCKLLLASYKENKCTGMLLWGYKFMMRVNPCFDLALHLCIKMFGSATRKILTKYLGRKFSFTLQEIFVILYTGMLYKLLIVYKNVLQVEIVLCRDHNVRHHTCFFVYSNVINRWGVCLWAYEKMRKNRLPQILYIGSLYEGRELALRILIFGFCSQEGKYWSPFSFGWPWTTEIISRRKLLRQTQLHATMLIKVFAVRLTKKLYMQSEIITQTVLTETEIIQSKCENLLIS